jgi:hypothetical protein
MSVNKEVNIAVIYKIWKHVCCTLVLFHQMEVIHIWKLEREESVEYVKEHFKHKQLIFIVCILLCVNEEYYLDRQHNNS